MDVEGDPNIMGKDVGSDQARKKSTYPALIGIDASRIKAKEAIDKAIAFIEHFDHRADVLRELALYAITRTK